MPRAWFALVQGYLRDPKLRRAGFEARMIWPIVLDALHPDDGFCSLDDLSAELLADLHGGDGAWWAAGLDGLRRVGLLVEGVRREKGGSGGFRSRAGWTTPNWTRYQIRRTDSERQPAIPTDPERSAPIRSDRHRSGAIGTDPERSDRSPHRT